MLRNKTLNLKFLFLLLLISILFTFLSYAQPQDFSEQEERQKIKYRRTDPNNFPSPEKYSQPKEQVFPVGYGTNRLLKVATGTGVWTELNPKVPRVTYIGLHFVNKDTGWACGANGAIVKTTNGGDYWTISETPVNNFLLKIHSYNGQVVIATGWDGIILRSSDAGENFEQITSGVGSGFDLWGVQMLNDTLGWVSGLNQTLLRTTDAGITWQQVNTSLNQHYWSLNFLNQHYGMIPCTGGTVLKTTDGGFTWQQIQAGDTRALYTIDVIDSLHIVAGGANGKNIYSSDGGTTWISNPDIPASSATNWIDFIDADTGYSVQDVYNIRKTTNRGQTWFDPNSEYLICYWHIQLLEDGTGYACGEEIGGSYALNFYKRTNGLDNWTRLFLNDNFNDIHFITETTGFALSTLLYKTIDGGINWVTVASATGGNDLLFLDSLTGFIGSNQIYKTIDGGLTWYVPNGGQGGAGKLFFVNETIGWAVRSNIIYKTTDRGENWFIQFSGSTDNFTSIFFIDTINGWATSRYIWQTTNGGSNWFQRMDIPAFFSNDIYFIDSAGFIIEFLDLYKTTNSGNSWFTQLNSQYIIRNFGWLDDQHGFIVGDGVYETTDVGNTWQEIPGLRNVGIRKFQAPLNYIGYSTGYKGLIYKYIDTSYVPVELVSFIGFYDNEKIILEWKTASELNNNGFEIQKSNDGGNSWQQIGFVSGTGTTEGYSSYRYEDINITDEKNYYRLKQIDFNGYNKYSNVVEVLMPIEKFYLYQNFPNPFNNSTTIKYIVPEKSFVQLFVYDIKGEKLLELLGEERDRGIYYVNLDFKNLGSGVYFYKMTTNKGYSRVRKLILLK